MIDKDRGLTLLKDQIDAIAAVRSQARFGPGFKKWHRDTEVVIEKVFGPGTRHLADFRAIEFKPTYPLPLPNRVSNEQYERMYQAAFDEAEAILQSMIRELDELPQAPSAAAVAQEPPRDPTTPTDSDTGVPTIRERLENNLTLTVLGMALAGFLAGLATYEGILRISGQTTIANAEKLRLQQAATDQSNDIPVSDTDPFDVFNSIDMPIVVLNRLTEKIDFGNVFAAKAFGVGLREELEGLSLTQFVTLGSSFIPDKELHSEAQRVYFESWQRFLEDPREPLHTIPIYAKYKNGVLEGPARVVAFPLLENHEDPTQLLVFIFVDKNCEMGRDLLKDYPQLATLCTPYASEDATQVGNANGP